MSLVQNIAIFLAYNENEPNPEELDADPNDPDDESHWIIQREEFYGQKVGSFIGSLPEKFSGENGTEARTSFDFKFTANVDKKRRYFNTNEFMENLTGFVQCHNEDFNFKNFRFDVINNILIFGEAEYLFSHVKNSLALTASSLLFEARGE